MTKVAILGGTSQIAKDFLLAYYRKDISFHIYSRNSLEIDSLIQHYGHLQKNVLSISLNRFPLDSYDVVINFVGAGNPQTCIEIGANIFDITYYYDKIVLEYLKLNFSCKYIFLSSGAAYGGDFEKPVTAETKAEVNFNLLKPQDWYSVAKLYAECRHRALSEYYIYDIRVFNYFSHTQDICARFLITDIIRAIKSNIILKTSPDYIVRDFVTPPDFCQLIDCIIKSPPQNISFDCYTKAPVDKPTLLKSISETFGLQYEFSTQTDSVNATGLKPYYYSLNRKAEDLGYAPTKTSLEGVTHEMELILKSLGHTF